MIDQVPDAFLHDLLVLGSCRSNVWDFCVKWILFCAMFVIMFLTRINYIFFASLWNVVGVVEEMSGIIVLDFQYSSSQLRVHVSVKCEAWIL